MDQYSSQIIDENESNYNQTSFVMMLFCCDFIVYIRQLSKSNLLD